MRSRWVSTEYLDLRCQLLEFWKTELGQLWFGEEQLFLQHLMSRCYGVHAVQLGLTSDSPLVFESGLPHCLIVDRSLGKNLAAACKVHLLSDPAQLALTSESVDLVLIHHGLDIAEHPKAWLREAARVLRPGGSLIVVGFNPWSLWGVLRWLGFPWHNAVWLRHALSLGRLTDWLGLLDFRLVEQQTGCFQIPGLFWVFKWLEPLLSWGMQRYFPNSGAFYSVLARKTTYAMTPWLRLPMQKGVLSPVWNLEHPFFRTLGITQEPMFPSSDDK